MPRPRPRPRTRLLSSPSSEEEEEEPVAGASLEVTESVEVGLEEDSDVAEDSDSDVVDASAEFDVTAFTPTRSVGVAAGPVSLDVAGQDASATRISSSSSSSSSDGLQGIWKTAAGGVSQRSRMQHPRSSR